MFVCNSRGRDDDIPAASFGLAIQLLESCNGQRARGVERHESFKTFQDYPSPYFSYLGMLPSKQMISIVQSLGLSNGNFCEHVTRLRADPRVGFGSLLHAPQSLVPRDEAILHSLCVYIYIYCSRYYIPCLIHYMYYTIHVML